MPRRAFQPLGQGQRLRQDGLAPIDRTRFRQRAQPVGIGLLQRARDAARQLVHARVGDAERLGGLAKGRARAERGVRGDHRHALLAVRLVDVRDHLVPALPAEVDVEIGTVAARRMEEALEIEPIANRIDVRDSQAVGDDRARARAAADGRDAAPARELHDVGDEQEVVGEAEPLDEPQLPAEAAQRFAPQRPRRAARIPAGHPRAAEAEQVAGARLALGKRRMREDRRAQLQLETAALDQRLIVGERCLGRLGCARRATHRLHAARPLGRSGEHRVLGLEGRRRHALEQLARGRGHRRPMRGVVAGGQQHHVRRRHRWNAETPRRGQAFAETHALACDATDAEP